MTTFNSGGRRSLDGPVRRRRDNQAVPEPAEAVLPKPMDPPEEPVFVYRKPKRRRLRFISGLRWVALMVLIVFITGVIWVGFTG